LTFLDAAAAYNTVKDHPITQNIANHPMTQNVVNGMSLEKPQ